MQSPERVLAVHGHSALKVSSVMESAAVWLPGCDVRGSDKVNDDIAQPVGWAQLIRCAEDRAHRTLATAPDANLAIGIESGVLAWGDSLLTLAAVYLEDREGRTGKALTRGVELPRSVARLVMGGPEVSEAVAAIYGPEYSRDCIGAVTGDHLQAVTFFSEAVGLAMRSYTRTTA